MNGMKKLIAASLMVVFTMAFSFSAYAGSLVIKVKDRTPELVEFNVNVRLNMVPVTYSNPLDDDKNQPQYVKDIFRIEGVEKIFVQQHSIIVYLGSAFSPKKIKSEIKAVLVKHFKAKN